jgi:hypothetical protein
MLLGGGVDREGCDCVGVAGLRGRTSPRDSALVEYSESGLGVAVEEDNVDTDLEREMLRQGESIGWLECSSRVMG